MQVLAKERIILGIDPGTNIMGYGIIIDKGKKIEMICFDVVKLDKLESQPLKLKAIFERLLDIIDKYHPDEMAIEAPFFGKNVQSMLKLGRAQGVAMASALYRDIPITEYSPRKVKQSITGRGNASKEQVAIMLQRLLDLNELPKHFDSTDALAVACCHYYQGEKAEPGKKYTGWAGFVNNNPDKVL
jgi:crossover junction endodeoxyribonuclease RuvC